MSLRQLSDLPTELLCLILQEFDSTIDFYSFIRASPQVYAAFITQKKSLLSKLLRRAVCAEVLQVDAQVTLRSSQFHFPKYGRIAGTPAQSDTFLCFIRNFEKSDYANCQVSLDLLIPLCRLQSGIEYLIGDYCIHFFTLWDQVAPRQTRGVKSMNPRIDRWGRLSNTELIRLQRAFYRYDTCQNMMRGIVASRSDFEYMYPQFEEFLSAFSPWEVDEIACVHSYMLRRLDQVTQKLEDEFVQSVVDASKIIRRNEDPAKQPSLTSQARLICLSKLLHPDESSEAYHCLGWSQSLFDEGRPEYFFSILAKESGDQYVQVNALATLGASFMRNFLESNSKRRFDLISSYGDTWSSNHENEFENSFPSGQLFSLQQSSELWNRMTTSGEESANRPNKAWLWAKENNPKGDFYRPCDRDLMAWGYVFWDSERLREMRVIEEPRPELSWSDTPPGPLAPERRTCLSAEQRLKDMGLI